MYVPKPGSDVPIRINGQVLDCLSISSKYQYITIRHFGKKNYIGNQMS